MAGLLGVIVGSLLITALISRGIIAALKTKMHTEKTVVHLSFIVTTLIMLVVYTLINNDLVTAIVYYVPATIIWLIYDLYNLSKTKCKFCAETIKKAAVTCKHCHKDINKQLDSSVSL